ncbi:MAG: uracil-DNA glycosylase [Thermomicrobiales bacterium]
MKQPFAQLNDELERYQAAMRACRRCVEAGFLATAHPVFRGNARQRLMIVGQAPGAQADARDVPWSGQSGRILRGWMAQAGFPEETFFDTWYLTSLTKCFPGKATGGKGDRAPSAAEIALCRGHLDREIALVRPDLIVTLGRLAAVALIPGVRKLPLAGLVGARYQADLGYGEIPIVPLPHPSGVSRWRNDPANRALIAQALALLNAERRHIDRVDSRGSVHTMETHGGVSGEVGRSSWNGKEVTVDDLPD